eukprot:8029495-Heterocapsa_arctica.AAC.1
MLRGHRGHCKPIEAIARPLRLRNAWPLRGHAANARPSRGHCGQCVIIAVMAWPLRALILDRCQVVKNQGSVRLSAK